MSNQRSLIGLLSLVVTASLASSCAHHAPQHPPAGSAKVSSSLNQAKACMSSGNYKKALEIYAAAYDRHPEDENLRDTYTDALESIKAEADKAYENQDYGRAGELYNTLSRSGFKERKLQGGISFGDDYLAMKMGACSKMLIELGISKYRAGDLEQAIAVWKKVLVFRPSDQEAKTSIDRATAQLQNLKQIK